MFKKISVWVVLGLLLVLISACAVVLFGDILAAIYFAVLAVFTVLISLRE